MNIFTTNIQFRIHHNSWKEGETGCPYNQNNDDHNSNRLVDARNVIASSSGGGSSSSSENYINYPILLRNGTNNMPISPLYPLQNNIWYWNMVDDHESKHRHDDDVLDELLGHIDEQQLDVMVDQLLLWMDNNDNDEEEAWNNHHLHINTAEVFHISDVVIQNLRRLHDNTDDKIDDDDDVMSDITSVRSVAAGFDTSSIVVTSSYRNALLRNTSHPGRKVMTHYDSLYGHRYHEIQGIEETPSSSSTSSSSTSSSSRTMASGKIGRQDDDNDNYDDNIWQSIMDGVKYAKGGKVKLMYRAHDIKMDKKRQQQKQQQEQQQNYHTTDYKHMAKPRNHHHHRHHHHDGGGKHIDDRIVLHGTSHRKVPRSTCYDKDWE